MKQPEVGDRHEIVRCRSRVALQNLGDVSSP